MARRVVKRREPGVSTEKRKKPTEQAAPPRRKSVRLKAYWSVLNSMGKEVAEFDYHAHAQAVQRAAELNDSKKSHHFVRMAKKEIAE